MYNISINSLHCAEGKGYAKKISIDHWWCEYHLHLIEYGLYSVPSIKDGI